MQELDLAASYFCVLKQSFEVFLFFLHRFDVVVYEVHLNRFWQLRVDNIFDHIFVFVGDCHFSLVELFSQVKDIDWVWVFLEQLLEMFLCGHATRVVLVLSKENIGFWFQRVWNLKPKQGYGASNLHERGHIWQQVLPQTVDVAYLLYFYKVCHIAVLIDTSLHVSCAGILPRPSSDDANSAIMFFKAEVWRPAVTIDHRHNPSLIFQLIVEWFDQKPVPHELRLVRIVLWKSLETLFLFPLFTARRIRRISIGHIVPSLLTLLNQLPLHGVRHIVTIRKVKTFSDFDVIKVFTVLLILDRVFLEVVWFEQGEKLCLFDLVDVVLANLSYFFLLSDHD